MPLTLTPTQGNEAQLAAYTKGSRPVAVVLTGAGISAESGLKTFRDSGGLWENHDVMEVASYEGYLANPQLVQDFYNARRKQAWAAKPNAGHQALAELEDKYDVLLITQNVDNLHERGGSSQVLHLHGRLDQAYPEGQPQELYQIDDQPIALGDLSPSGAQLRPNIVWFGEPVYNIELAAQLVPHADVFIVAGTSLAVYPAASLIYEVPSGCPVYVVDPHTPPLHNQRATALREPASTGLPKLVAQLLEQA